MFKSVSFNIFEENLQNIVYGEKSAREREKMYRAEKNVGKTIRKSTEIIIKPLNKERSQRHTEKF